MTITLYHGDCRHILSSLSFMESIDSVVTDPPYGLNFMGKNWDDDIAFGVDTWRYIFRVMKPGGHLVAFGGTRKSHRMTCAIEDAGFEIRDTIAWLYGSGFPKSYNIGNGWGTTLKPAYEPIILARKPLQYSTVAENTLLYGTGGLNIDACRVETTDGTARPVYAGSGNPENWRTGNKDCTTGGSPLGRWPANVCHDGSDEVEAAFAAFGTSNSSGGGGVKTGIGLPSEQRTGHKYHGNVGFGDTGTVSRFFYCAKASTTERNGSDHPTVKPLELMKWLVRMVTPKRGVVLDPFCGSGTTLLAAEHQRFHAIGIDITRKYVEASKRLVRSNDEIRGQPSI